MAASSTAYALVTGGNRGLGFAVVQKLLAAGKPVILACRSAGAGEAAARQLARQGELRVLQLDSCSPETISAAARAVAANHNQQIDLLINNAAMLDFAWSQPVFERTIATNFTGPMHIIRELAPLLAPGALIVNVSSALGLLQDQAEEYRERIAAATSLDDLAAIPFYPGSKQAEMFAPAYDVSKAMIIKATQLLAKGDPVLAERGIRVVSICPGWCRTSMGTDEATRSAEQGADSILWWFNHPEGLVNGSFTRDGQPVTAMYN